MLLAYLAYSFRIDLWWLCCELWNPAPNCINIYDKRLLPNWFFVRRFGLDHLSIWTIYSFSGGWCCKSWMYAVIDPSVYTASSTVWTQFSLALTLTYDIFFIWSHYRHDLIAHFILCPDLLCCAILLFICIQSDFHLVSLQTWFDCPCSFIPSFAILFMCMLGGLWDGLSVQMTWLCTCIYELCWNNRNDLMVCMAWTLLFHLFLFIVHQLFGLILFTTWFGLQASQTNIFVVWSDPLFCFFLETSAAYALDLVTCSPKNICFIPYSNR